MMTTILAFLSGLLVLLLFLFSVLYATWFFGSRIRRGKPKSKSFLRWLRDLFDALSGLG